ncbi:hypothetical protein CAPTEDRAFT_131610 [Capitella teleta]|uniref:Uncharacterized protein n=1 Tax=Capitella teleta TaxID=283909 RepID=R7UJ82_CAPTE|nr:hypothetical protein CAPTEDRAFT_131610 [Capitella teleta]|eukprot:ELU03853.1 hypothetical protein CAPTEDRAFT_131610 [Capitella teleta]
MIEYKTLILFIFISEVFRGELNVWGLVGVIAFYIVILIIGIYASWKTKSLKSTDSEDVMVAGRSIGIFVGVFTMTSTWVGGGYINGTAEVVFTPGSGLMWCQAPVGYALSLMLGGFIFAKKMREAGYITMLDPLQLKYGRVMAALLYIPALFGDIFWTGAILSALGASLSVIVGLAHTWAVIASAGISILYTLLGGLYSVAYTDVIQLICIFVGLWLCVPFALTHEAVSSISSTISGPDGWLGEDNLSGSYIGMYIDSGLLLIFGGIPWQVYFQRVLSQKTAARAQMLSFLAAGGCFIMAIPAVLIGAIGKSTDWNATGYTNFGSVPIPAEDYKLILPMVLNFLTPVPVAVIGLGAVSAAVMSSSDSSVLSSASMFARNVYKPLRNAIGSCCFKAEEASEREIMWCMRIAIILVGVASSALAITVDSIYGLWYLCSDLVYVILFPQLLCCVHIPFTNTYGSIAGFILGLIFRFTGGEPLLNLPAAIEYWYFDAETGYQCFPFKTMSMLISLLAILLGSLIAKWLFKKGILSPKFDIARAFFLTESAYETKEMMDVPLEPMGSTLGTKTWQFLTNIELYVWFYLLFIHW